MVRVCNGDDHTQFKDKLTGLEEKDREDALVRVYSESVKRVGVFAYTSSAIVLHPTKDRTHFHLIYATRDLRGIEVFKDAEKKAMPVMEKTRDEAQKRGREERTRQTELTFSTTDATDSSAYFRSLRNRYVTRAMTAVLEILQSERRVLYDKAWSVAMPFPLIWESDLKGWLHDWKTRGRLNLVGMKEGQRVPKREQRIQIVWND